jgi:hypothetical protein
MLPELYIDWHPVTWKKVHEINLAGIGPITHGDSILWQGHILIGWRPLSFLYSVRRTRRKKLPLPGSGRNTLRP